MNMASTSKLEIQSSATGPVIQGDHNFIFLRDSHVTQQSELDKTDVIETITETTLHAAVENWNVDLVKKLIVEDGVDVNVTNDSNQTPLEALLSTVTPDCDHSIIASTALRSTVAVLLEHGASVNMKLNEEHTYLLLSSALKSNKLDLLESLLKQGLDLNSRARWNDSVLHEAAELINLEAVKMLITYGADTNIPGNLQVPPVWALIQHIAIKKRAIDQEVIDVIELLNCKKYAKVSYCSTDMLHVATNCLHAELIELLINTYGIDVNKRNNFSGDTPLHVVIWRLNESPDKEEVLKVVQTLIRCGASLTITDSVGRTPLKILEEYYDTYRYQYLIPYLTPHNHNNEMCCCVVL